MSDSFKLARVGHCWGDMNAYSWPIDYPLLVLLSAAIAWCFGAIDTCQADRTKIRVNISLGSMIGIRS